VYTHVRTQEQRIDAVEGRKVEGLVVAGEILLTSMDAMARKPGSISH
jgi:imidazole glycerol phosphate synthase subunit HisF